MITRIILLSIVFNKKNTQATDINPMLNLCPEGKIYKQNNKITLEYGSFNTKALTYKYLLENKSSEYVFDFYNLESEGFSALDRKLGATEKDGFENKRYSINGKHFFDDNPPRLR